MVGSNPPFFIHRLLFLAHFILYYVFRLQGDRRGLLNKSDEKMEFEVAEDDLSGFGHDLGEEEEKPEVFLKFKFPTFEEFRQNQTERGNKFMNSEGVPSMEDSPVEEINDANVNLGDSCVKSAGKGGFSGEEIEPEFRDESMISSDSNDFGFLSDMDFNKNRDSGVEESDVDLETLEQSVELEQDPQEFASDFLSEQDFDDDYSDNLDDADFGRSESDCDDDDEDEDADSLWEEQELMEQLKMELKKVRASGLPTILEESEASPKILMDGLKPLKMDEFQRDDCISELHKFYKTYRERMRKFDIVSYQKMYAMGCLQLKDPLQSIPKQKSSSAAFKSLLSQNLRLSKNKIHGADPMKFIKEVQDDVESVYVAQTCLSWEFLQWQYEKALDLWDADPEGRRRYNEVAGEFQQFQVLLQRFIENEPFKGPRTQNYINTRRNVHRNLLQVPVIRQDNQKDKRKGRKYFDDHDYIITSEMLVEILEESIRLFWQFVRADKDCATPETGTHKKLPYVACPEDVNLLMEAKKLVQKKERKLRDLVRSRNCILKKCRQRDGYDQVLCFFSQVDIRLVARTLNMSRITREQLMWCLDKLNKISFLDRKIHVERAFLLFPC